MDRAEDQRTTELARALGSRLTRRPELAVVLGSGLGRVAEAMGTCLSFDAAELPHFPLPSIPGHPAVIHAGELAGRATLIFAGRVHLYEGHDLATVTRPVRVLARLGAGALVLTNTAGSTRPDLDPGTILHVRDAFHWMAGRMGAAGANADRIPTLDRAFDQASSDVAVRLRPGVLAAGLGPNYETAAEVAMLRHLGADAVTMSTVPEFAAARAAGLPVIILTLVTNWATGIAGPHLTHREVTERAASAAGDLARLIVALARRL